MKWRVMVELTGSDGVIRSQEDSAGGSNASECSAATVGLTLADAQPTLAGLQDHLVRAAADEYCRQRRGLLSLRVATAIEGCPHATSVVFVRNSGGSSATFFALTVCGDQPAHAHSCRRNHARSVHTRANERVIAKMGSLPSVRPGHGRCCRNSCRSATFRPWRRPAAGPCEWALGWNSRRHRAKPAAPAAEARAISLFIDGGHVRSVRSYQVRSFEAMLAQVSNDNGKQEGRVQQYGLRRPIGNATGCAACYMGLDTPSTPVTILSDGAEGPRSSW